MIWFLSLKAEAGMLMLHELFFVSSNIHKFHEAQKILKKYDITLKFFKADLPEIQSSSLIEIAKHKALTAFELCRKPLIVEDDGLFINSLNGFPGPFSSYVFNTIGNSGILNLVTENRAAYFMSVISFCDVQQEPKLFESKLNGTISEKISDSGWGYDPIFIPNGESKTFSKLEHKNDISHRSLSLKKFSNWFLHKH